MRPTTLERIEKIKKLKAEGKTNKEIAFEMKMGLSTVTKHAQNMKKAYVRRRILKIDKPLRMDTLPKLDDSLAISGSGRELGNFILTLTKGMQ